MHLVVWAGPVSAAMLKRVRWSSPTAVLTIGEGYPPCKIACPSRAPGCMPSCIGSSAFGHLGDKVKGSLKRLLLSKRMDLAEFTRVAFAGFSAAHGLANKLFQDPASLEVVDAFGAFDSYYTGPEPAIKAGYLAFAEKAASNKGLMVVTCSSSAAPDGAYIASDQAVVPLIATVSQGRTSQTPPSWESPGAPLTYRRGSFYYFNNKSIFTHENHARVLAPWFLEHVISPYMVELDQVGVS